MRPRRRFEQARPQQDTTRINESIRVPRVRLVDSDGSQVGIKPTAEALEYAYSKDLDLVEVAATADPPVARIMDYGKYKYEAQKKAHEARKHQKVIEVKEIKMRPNIDDHDYEVKMRAMKRFIEEGDKVKVTLRFRGREMVHSDLGMQVLNRVRGEMDLLTKIESMPRMEGRQMIMVLAPKKTGKPSQKAPAKAGAPKVKAASPAKSETAQAAVEAEAGSEKK